MDGVDNNDFLDVFHVIGWWKQYLYFTWMLWIIMTSFVFFMYLVIGNNIWILHGCYDFLDVFYVFGCWKQYLDLSWLL